MPAPDLPINLDTIRARQEQERLRLAAESAYQTYLISRSRGVAAAVEPALACWRSAEQRYLLTCHTSKGAAPGDAESLGAAREGCRTCRDNLDMMIRHWRRWASGSESDTTDDRQLTECAPHYVNALQTVRMNQFGELLPREDESLAAQHQRKPR